jgi:sulfopyruvate decarboxylase alpha subunit
VKFTISNAKEVLNEKPRPNRGISIISTQSESLVGSSKADCNPDYDWPDALYHTLKAEGVRQMCYVPDAGHSALIEKFNADADVKSNVLTTEEEGVAVATGAWLGGMRSVLLMQSSGVGNCINMLSLPVQTRAPLLMLVTMRGEWDEFNPWQMPVGQATQGLLEAVGVRVFRAETGIDVVETVEQAARMAFDADQQIAVLIGQRLLGKKKW